jgi:hypothetical protein
MERKVKWRQLAILNISGPLSLFSGIRTRWFYQILTVSESGRKTV